jgi:hypothetical protein
VNELSKRLDGFRIVFGCGEKEIVASLQRIKPRSSNRIQ